MNRLARIVVAASVVLATAAGSSGPVAAEISPAATDGVWGFSGDIGSDFNNFDAAVWAIEQIGSRIYVGGKFTTAVAGPGGRTETRAALAAFDSFSGDLLTDFSPDIRGGGVYAIEATPDGKLFVGGEFTSVEGEPDTAGLVQLDPRTGALDPNWRGGLERPWSVSRPSARSIEIHGDSLYVAGNFSHVKSGRQRVRLHRIARLSVSTGRIDPSFNPLVAGGAIWDIALSPDASRVYLAGYFSSVNGDPVHGDRFAAVSTADGSMVEGMIPFEPNLDATGRQYAVEAVGSLVFVAGEEHMLQVLNASDLSRNRVYFTGSDPATGAHPLLGGGDFQDMEVVGNRLYASCHCWVTILDPDTGPDLFPTDSPPPGERRPVRSVVAFDGTTGDLVGDFGLDVSGVAGAWAIHGSPDGCLWAGGDLTQSSGTWLQGLGRWCDSDGPTTDTTRPSTPRGLRLTENTPGAITVSWTGSTDDVAVAGYEVYRSDDGSLGSYVGTSVTTSFTDTLLSPNITYTYAVKAIDTSSNLSWRTNLVTATASDFEDTVRPTTVRGLETLTTEAGIQATWSGASDNVAVAGYRIYRSADGETPAAVADTAEVTWIDTEADPGIAYTYYVRSFDAAGNVGWRSNRSTATA